MITFFTTDIGRLALRLGMALLCGTAIGIERKWRGRQAGLRTTLLVALGAAIFTDLSANAFGPLTDKSRIAAQIVSGIGFLGAGVILRQGQSIQGLNTAATLWAASAIGMAAGIVSYDVALLATVGVLLVQLVFRPVAGWVDQRTVRNAPRFRYWLTVVVDAPATGEVQDMILTTIAERAIERVSTRLSTREVGDVIMEFVLVSPAQEVSALEGLFPDLMQLAVIRNLTWRSEAETRQRGLLRRRSGGRRLTADTEGTR